MQGLLLLALIFAVLIALLFVLGLFRELRLQLRLRSLRSTVRAQQQTIATLEAEVGRLQQELAARHVTVDAESVTTVQPAALPGPEGEPERGRSWLDRVRGRAPQPPPSAEPPSGDPKR